MEELPTSRTVLQNCGKYCGQLGGMLDILYCLLIFSRKDFWETRHCIIENSRGLSQNTTRTVIVVVIVVFPRIHMYVFVTRS